MLTYLFVAQFNDGTFICQTQDDRSTINPSKSAFFDVLQKQDEVAIFNLVSKSGKTVAFVDLRDGSFCVNNTVFNAGDPRTTPEPGTKPRLIFFRRHTHCFNAQTSHDVEYHIGYQWNDAHGKNHQQTVSLR